MKKISLQKFIANIEKQGVTPELKDGAVMVSGVKLGTVEGDQVTTVPISKLMAEPMIASIAALAAVGC